MKTLADMIDREKELRDIPITNDITCPRCKQTGTIEVLTDGSVVCTSCGYFYPAN